MNAMLQEQAQINMKFSFKHLNKTLMNTVHILWLVLWKKLSNFVSGS